MSKKLKTLAMSAALVAVASPAWATNGYFAHGYGGSSKAMGGTGVTMGDGPLAAAQNPAIGVTEGNVAGLCFTNFMPHRDATFEGAGPVAAGKYESENEYFPILCGGVNYMLREDTSVGLLMFGNGGMNTEYDSALFANFGAGTAPTGVDLAQAFLALNIAHEVAPGFRIGVAPVLAIQYFSATGLQAFEAMSLHPDSVSNNGYDWSIGGGVKVGAVWDATPWLSLGVSYQSRMWMTAFDKYKGLFAEEGSFDIAPYLSSGIAIKPHKDWAILLEHQRIFYSDIAAIANSGVSTSALGSDDGAGFGWNDMDVFKLGVQWQATQDLVLRGGFSWGTDFTDGTQVLFNTLAPATTTTHITFGVGYRLNERWSVQASYTHAFSNELTGVSAMTGQTETIRMDQDELAVGFSYRF